MYYLCKAIIQFRIAEYQLITKKLKLTQLEILHFEQLKKEIQNRYLEFYTPSHEEISRWKGIDIIYFQEDLRKKAKGNISEKSFYTYFKTSPVTKLPRIDMLNLLSIYAGYQSWHDYKKQHLFEDESLSEVEESNEESQEQEIVYNSSEKNIQKKDEEFISPHNPSNKNSDIQITKPDYQSTKSILQEKETLILQHGKSLKKKVIEYLWIGISLILATAAILLGFRDQIFGRYFTYCFTDADRNSVIKGELEIKVIKENESPLFYRIKPGECFYYSTKDKELKMEISSTLYENQTIDRKLETAPKEETIELKPDDYKMAVDYFSKKNTEGEADLSKKREQLDRLISNDAVISQIYDNDVYGLETISKQKYITLVTTPTTSLKNLKVIEMKREKGKIVLIKFKISSDENK